MCDVYSFGVLSIELVKGYPKETIGYSFYSPPKNKVLVARNAEFLENSLINQEASGIIEDLEIIQEEDTHPSIDISLNHEEDNLEIDEPQSDIVPIRRSTRTRHAPDRMCLYIDAEEHDLGDLGEPANYKAALLDPESEKWLNAMNVEMQYMKDNEVWVLAELPPNGKTVGSKWLFKKKTNMDGNVHTYKARLVVKGYTQTSGIDYEETFSAVADIRAIRILIAIAAYYDYEIWQMDIKTAFLNGYLNEEVYMEQPEGFVNLKYPNQNSKRGSILMQEKLKLSKSQGASTPAELKRMQNVPYASAVGSIMYAMRCTLPNVAFAQNVTSRFQQNPGDLYWTTVKNILKYLRNTKDMFLVYRGDLKRKLRVSCYTDAGYLTDADDLKSQTGYVFVLNGGAVDWKSAQQSILATSSIEAEYIAAFDASKEAVWVRKFISGLGVIPTIEEPISMYCDNTGAISIANESRITKGARHFHAKVHYLHEVIEYDDIKLEKVHTDDNLADPFTKALAFPKHSEHTRNIGMLPANSLIWFVAIDDMIEPTMCWFELDLKEWCVFSDFGVLGLKDFMELLLLRVNLVLLMKNEEIFYVVNAACDQLVFLAKQDPLYFETSKWYQSHSEALIRRNNLYIQDLIIAYTSSSSSSSSNLDIEVSTCSKACLKSYKTLKEHYDNLTKDFNKSQFNLGAYKACLESAEARLEEYKKNEAVFEDAIKILKLNVMFRDKAIIELRQKFEIAEKEEMI
nr:putative retrotransposon protein [Tanacetum cinerariifolium]